MGGGHAPPLVVFSKKNYMSMVKKVIFEVIFESHNLVLSTLTNLEFKDILFINFYLTDCMKDLSIYIHTLLVLVFICSFV